MRGYSVLYLLPNLISFSRIFLTFVFAFCISQRLVGSALIVFIIAAVSDFLDGYIARFLKVESVFGSMLDPLADKCLIIVSYLILGYIGVISSLLSVIVIVKDLAILFVVCLCEVRKISLKFRPLFSSKINTTVQLTYVTAVLGYEYFFPIHYMPYMSLILRIGALIVGASTAFSAMEYIQKYYWIKDAICTRK